MLKVCDTICLVWKRDRFNFRVLQPDMNDELVEDGERDDSFTSPEKALQVISLSWQGVLEMVGRDYDQ